MDPKLAEKLEELSKIRDNLRARADQIQKKMDSLQKEEWAYSLVGPKQTAHNGEIAGS